MQSFNGKETQYCFLVLTVCSFLKQFSVKFRQKIFNLSALWRSLVSLPVRHLSSHSLILNFSSNRFCHLVSELLFSLLSQLIQSIVSQYLFLIIFFADCIDTISISICWYCFLSVFSWVPLIVCIVWHFLTRIKSKVDTSGRKWFVSHFNCHSARRWIDTFPIRFNDKKTFAYKLIAIYYFSIKEKQKISEKNLFYSFQWKKETDN